MAHIGQKLVNIIHLLAVSADRTHWYPLVMQLQQLRGGVTPTCSTLTFLEYTYSLTSLHSVKCPDFQTCEKSHCFSNVIVVVEIWLYSINMWDIITNIVPLSSSSQITYPLEPTSLKLVYWIQLYHFVTISEIMEVEHLRQWKGS